MKHILTLSLALLLCAGIVTAQAPVDPRTAPELKAHQQVARLYQTHAQWCFEHRQQAAGLEAVAAAVTVGGASPSLTKLKAGLEQCTPAEPDKLLNQKRSELDGALQKAHAKVLQAALEAKAPERGEPALLAMVRFGAAAATLRKGLTDLLKAADSNNDLCARLLLHTTLVDPQDDNAKAWQAARESLGLKDCFLLKSPEHAMVAWVALPGAWKRGRKDIPVVVAVEGAGSNFRNACRHFREMRGTKDALIVVPWTLSNTNAINPASYPTYSAELIAAHESRMTDVRFTFDDAGLHAILKQLRTDWGAAEKYAITGFSGGGFLTYWSVLRHADELTFALGACANFGGGGLSGAVPAVDGGPPIYLCTGEKDEFNLEVFGQKPGIIGQTDAVESALKQLGFSRLTRRVIPAVGHSNLAAEVWKLMP